MLSLKGREASGEVVQRLCPESGNHFLVYRFTDMNGKVHEGKKRLGGGPGECKVPPVQERAPVVYLEAKPEVNAWEGPRSRIEFLLGASLLFGVLAPISNQVWLSHRADA